MSHRRLTGSRLALLSDRLTPRDHKVLRSLATVHAATTDQVARCVFPRAPSGLRLARRHLHRLITSGLVRRFADRSRDRWVGTPGHVYALTSAGLRLAGGHHALGHRQRHAWRPTPAFLAHRLAISELFAQLTEQQAAGGPLVREFQAEPGAWRSYLGPAGEQLVLRPDALVRLALPDGHENSWFIEVDRDTETRAATMAAKCQAYQRYEASGHEQRRHGVFPGVAFIVPSVARAAQIRAVIARQPPEIQPLFRVTSDDQALAALAELEPTA
ncbi:replication-relaxation family protein [Actinosynnema sp. NPDC051121]